MCLRLIAFRTIVLFLLVANVSVGQSQTNQTTAHKFDEFGDIQRSELIARLDNFAVELLNEPNAKGFILAYRTRRDIPGLSHSLAMRMKFYLAEKRGLPKERLVAVDGGVAEHLIQELWVVPIGSAPVPRSDARIGYLLDPATVWKFNEVAFLPLDLYRKFGVPYNRDAEVEYLEAYANEVKKKANRTACLIAYAQFNPRTSLADYSGDYEPVREVKLDPPGTARKHLLREKDFLIREYGIAASRIKTIDGGYRKRRGIEYWIVPEGESLPIPTPNSFPGRKRRR